MLVEFTTEISPKILPAFPPNFGVADEQMDMDQTNEWLDGLGFGKWKSN